MDITSTKNEAISIKKRVYEILDIPSPNDRISRTFDVFMMSLISLNILVLILQTFKTIANYAHSCFLLFEIISIVIFSVEYILRIWSCTANPKYNHTIWGRLKFLFRPLVLVDLLAILPFYLSFSCFDTIFLRVFRLFRLFRILKVARYSQALRLFGHIVYKKKEQLLVSLSFLLLLLVLSSFLMFFAEHKAQPQAFFNILNAFWWAFVSFTTIGYGDVYPKTILGKFIASITSFIGIMIFALPTSILTSAFIEEYHDNKEDGKCPHCGKNL